MLCETPCGLMKNQNQWCAEAAKWLSQLRNVHASV